MWSRWKSPTTTRVATGRTRATIRSAGTDHTTQSRQAIYRIAPRERYWLLAQLSLTRRCNRAERQQGRRNVKRISDAAERIANSAHHDRAERLTDPEGDRHRRDRGRPHRGRIVVPHEGGGRAHYREEGDAEHQCGDRKQESGVTEHGQSDSDRVDRKNDCGRKSAAVEPEHASPHPRRDECTQADQA